MKLKIIILSLLIIPSLVFAQDVPKKKAYFFYGDSCPHCKKVEAYFQENGIYDKYDITSLEFSNPFNTRLLLKFGDVFNDPNKGAVPAVAFGDKFIVGDQPIMDNFVREIDAADNANELPDPDKITNKSGDNSSAAPDNQANPTVQQSANQTSGNKKNYFPVIVGALVVLGVGALIFVNRKKS